MKFGIRIVFYASLAAAGFICAGAAHPAQAQVKETVLWTFTGGSDGNGPAAALIADEKGALYGTAQIGGALNSPLCFGVGCGTVFKLTPPARGQTGWAETTLWSFSGGNDGANPFGALLARNGSPSLKKRLYGTSSFGGMLSACGGFGCGTIFKLTDGALATLWSFTGGNDGANPFGTLIGDEENGPLYGTTQGGGASGNGTVFKIDAIDQSLITIYSFLGSPDGASPGKALLANDDGALYGTTFGGGLHGNGTVFKLTPPGWGQTAWTETVLWSFTRGNDGANPYAGLIADERGALYGTTVGGGADGAGVVFRLTPPAHGQTGWTLSTLYAFTGGSDGGSSFAGLIADGSGALYGTTQSGGAINTAACPVTSGCGVVFKLIPREHGQVPWTQIVLWTFSGGSDGGIPQAELIADETGALFGTTVAGGNVTNPQGPCGDLGCGVVYKLTGTGFVPKDED